MHVKKNICDNVLGTLMNVDGKTKDNSSARRDLALLGIKKDLHLQVRGQQEVMPQALFTLTKDEGKKCCEWLKGVKFLDAYASNIS